jgi:hypothetical protein
MLRLSLICASFTDDAPLSVDPNVHWTFGGVAHRLEQAAHNRLVDGSIPSTPTITLTFYQAYANIVSMGNENFPNPEENIHPELIGMAEAAMPAEQLTKQALLSTIADKLVDAPRYMYDDDLSCEVFSIDSFALDNDRVLSLCLYDRPRIGHEAAVVHIKEPVGDSTQFTNFHLIRTREGLDGEKSVHYREDKTEEELEQQSTADLFKEIDTRDAAYEQEKTLGLNIMTEADVMELIREIEQSSEMLDSEKEEPPFDRYYE